MFSVNRWALMWRTRQECCYHHSWQILLLCFGCSTIKEPTRRDFQRRGTERLSLCVSSFFPPLEFKQCSVCDSVSIYEILSSPQLSYVPKSALIHECSHCSQKGSLFFFFHELEKTVEGIVWHLLQSSLTWNIILTDCEIFFFFFFKCLKSQHGYCFCSLLFSVLSSSSVPADWDPLRAPAVPDIRGRTPALWLLSQSEIFAVYRHSTDTRGSTDHQARLTPLILPLLYVCESKTWSQMTHTHAPVSSSSSFVIHRAALQQQNNWKNKITKLQLS